MDIQSLPLNKKIPTNDNCAFSLPLHIAYIEAVFVGNQPSELGALKRLKNYHIFKENANLWMCP